MTHISYIYFIQQEFTACVKIGFSKNILNRLYNLQNGSPFDLKIIGLIDPGSASPAKLEEYLHKKFGVFSMRGEWFQGAQEILDFAAQYPYNADSKKLIKLAANLESLIELQYEFLPVKRHYPAQWDVANYALFNPKKELDPYENVDEKTKKESIQLNSWVAKMIAEGKAVKSGNTLRWLVNSNDR